MMETKPCWYCESTAVSVEPMESESSTYWVECLECLCRGPKATTISEAWRLWNNRPAEFDTGAAAKRV